MDFSRIVKMIPESKRQTLSDTLVDCILTSKNDDIMPSALAYTLLRCWQQNLLESEHGFATLLETAVLLEPEKTVAALSELQLTSAAEEIKAELNSQWR